MPTDDYDTAEERTGVIQAWRLQSWEEHMSENTYWLITERADGLFDLSRSWAEADIANPEIPSYRRNALSLKQATKIADQDPAEYGYWIQWYIPDEEAFHDYEKY